MSKRILNRSPKMPPVTKASPLESSVDAAAEHDVDARMAEAAESGPWIRTCQECGHKQEDKRPSAITELTDAYRERKCKKCKSQALDFGSEVVPNELKPFVCEKCGPIDYAEMDGYAFGDRLLEGVMFRVRRFEDNDLEVTIDPDSKDYFESLNMRKWLGLAVQNAEDDPDSLMCPTCKEGPVS